jgi:hypothetical protein
MYDSRLDTREHIAIVNRNIHQVVSELLKRADWHDNTKLQPGEVEAFDKVAPKLKELTYGSDEYKEAIKELEPALEHHYINNRHHPEYHTNGISSMNLIDLIEMFCDWQAATMRNKDGDLLESIKINTSRFNIATQLESVFVNTAKDMGWVENEIL